MRLVAASLKDLDNKQGGSMKRELEHGDPAEIGSCPTEPHDTEQVE